MFIIRISISIYKSILHPKILFTYVISAIRMVKVYSGSSEIHR